MAAILDGRAIAAASLTQPDADLRAYLLACYPKASIPPLDHIVLTAEPLAARVNHGIWIASCPCGAPADKVPTPGCVVFLDQPLGWCVRCGNQSWGGGWRRIVVPPPEERALIEAVLMSRPNVGDRNWEPGETVAMLVAQNREHGDPVPDLVVQPLGPLHGPRLAELVAPFPPAAIMRDVLTRLSPRRGLRRLLRR